MRPLKIMTYNRVHLIGNSCIADYSHYGQWPDVANEPVTLL
ncbi:MAG TPA: hypothetical protein VFD56_01565 [Chitinophagaceae bacterium]|nr:hypothetical protein [Chitinophagaceae bacterium]